MAEACASGRSAMGGGMMFLARTSSINHALGKRAVVVPSIVIAFSGNMATAVE